MVEVGDRVRNGSPMVEVDRATFKILLDQAEANLAAATQFLEANAAREGVHTEAAE